MLHPLKGYARDRSTRAAMSTAACERCGQPIDAEARFCQHCGAAQVGASSEPEPPLRPGSLWVRQREPASSEPQHDFRRHAPERVEQAAPGAGDLAHQVGSQFASPGVAAAGLAALLTAGLLLATGMLLSVLPAKGSLFLFEQGSFVDKTLLYVATLSSAPLHVSAPRELTGPQSIQIMPMIFVLLPLGGMAAFTASQQRRLAQLGTWRRLAFGAAGAIPLAALVLVAALAGRISTEGLSVKASAGAAFLLTLLWGAIGGLAGAWWTLDGEGRGAVSDVVPPRARPGLRAASATLRPLAIALALTTVIGTGIVVVQTLRDVDGLKGGRSTFAAMVEDALYAPEHGLHVFQLGSFVQFKTAFHDSRGVPIPVEKIDELLGPRTEPTTDFNNPLEITFREPTVRLFDYGDAIPTGVFVLALLVFVAIPVLFALYAGFCAARAVAAATPMQAAAAGALTGPAWAITLLTLNGVANKTRGYALWGFGDGASTFGFALLIGATLGAVGGLLAIQATPLPSKPHAPT
jgi:hypothetical protein